MKKPLNPIRFSLDKEQGILVATAYIGAKAFLIEIPVSKIYEIKPVKWDKKAGEKLEDVEKKKPLTELIFNATVKEVK